MIPGEKQITICENLCAGYNQSIMAETLKSIIKKDPAGLLARAYAFAEKAHSGQKRQTGEPYFNHPVATAEILMGWGLDPATIAAGLLHDTVEDTAVTLADVKKEFGPQVAFIVDGVTKLGRLKYRGATEKAENMRKLILALSQDLRVVFVKLADRLHNMRTLRALPPAKQKRIALETDEIYAPLAYRLGMQHVSGELLDLAFPYLHPKEYEWLKKTAAARYETRLKYLEELKPKVEALLVEHGLKPLAIDFRAKRYSSLYKKLLRHDTNLDKIYDLVAMRIIMETVAECYAALGVLHEAWPPLPGRIKDYIALPKPNGYRSLHTTVFGPGQQVVEFQIRTKAMHEEDETGVAAHWLYKTKGSGSEAQNLTHEIAWVQQLREWQEHMGSDPEALIESMKVDFFRDRIFALTPQGDVFDLPLHATPVDFAYRIHSNIGDSAVGARVNGAIVPLDHELQSGDMVEIITQKGKRPSEDWLNFVASAGARERIRTTLRRGNRLAQSTRTPAKCALKVTTEDRVGLIKDISGVIARSHFNILAFHVDETKGSHYPINKIELNTADRAKIEKLVVKLKTIKGVKEISYRLI
jgi:GTP pyrophosphokinase